MCSTLALGTSLHILLVSISVPFAEASGNIFSKIFVLEANVAGYRGTGKHEFALDLPA